MVNIYGFEFSLTWIALLFLTYSIFFIWIIGKIEKKFNKKKERIKELEEALLQKDNILQENIEKNTKEKDFIENLLESSKKFTDKFESEEIEQKKKTEKSRIQRGKEFEWQIYNHYNNLGYQVENRSAKYKKLDGGIDILAKKGNLYTLIQCKNFAPTTKIKHNLVKEFHANCIDFINKNSKKLNDENTKFLLVISNYESLEISALHYLNDKINKCEYLEIKYIEE